MEQAREALANSPEVFSADEVDAAIDRLGARVNDDLAEANPIFLVVMHGGLPFGADLLRRFMHPCDLAYVHVSRYHANTVGGTLSWRQHATASLADRHVLLVDDVLDQGVTLRELRRYCQAEGALSVRAAVLVRKDVPECASHAEYIALEAQNRYLFGRGMDYAGYWRNLAAIHCLAD